MQWKSLTPNLMVEDVAATLAWYTDVLGFTTVTTVPGDDGALNFGIAVRDSVQLMFQRRASLESDVPALTGVPIAASQTFYIEVDDVDGLYGPIAEHVNTVVPLHDTFYHTREVYFRDLNSYVLSFSQPIAAE